MVGVMAVVLLFILISLSFVSANAPFDHRYKGPAGKSSSDYYYKSSNDGSGNYDSNGNYRYNIKKHANTPIFKGSYGNYRYQMYDNGDYKPTQYFVDYPDFGYGPYFSGGSLGYYGGFGGYGGGLGYGGFGLGISRYSPSYSYNNYGNSYYPSYDYQYLGGCSYSYC